MLISWVVASAGGTTLPTWPVEDTEASLTAWPIVGLIVLMVIVGLFLVNKRYRKKSMNTKYSNLGSSYELMAAVCVLILGIAFAYSSFRQGDLLAAGVMAIGSFIPMLLALDVVKFISSMLKR